MTKYNVTISGTTPVKNATPSAAVAEGQDHPKGGVAVNAYSVERIESGYRIVPLLDDQGVPLQYARKDEIRATVNGERRTLSKWRLYRPWFETEAAAQAWIDEYANYDRVEAAVRVRLAEIKAVYDAAVAEAIKPRSAAARRLTNLQPCVQVPRSNNGGSR